MTTTIVKTSILCGALLATAVAGALTSTEAEAKTTECTEHTSKEADLLIVALRRAYAAECERLGPSA